ncbi:MAG TPA: hypothetical protein VMX74_03510 [Pirellulales bacterium]|nr:hypothetical protein [Pirellulales bacterium]
MPVELIGLLAQTQAQAQATVTQLPMWYEQLYGLLGILAAIVAVSVIAGKAISGSVRMKDYEWKISVVVFAALAATAVIGLGVATDTVKGGIDLAGGTILIYELDQEKKQEVLDRTPDLGDLMKKMVSAVSRRLDPAGVKQITIRQIGEEQIEIIIPKVTQEEVRQIMRSMESAGNLEFRILADRQLDGNLIARAEATPGDLIRDKDEDARRSDDRHIVLIEEAGKDDGDEVMRSGRARARWVPVPETKRVEVEADEDLVTRGSGANLEKLVIVGQVRAQWVKIGETEDGEPRVDVRDGFWPTRLREDGGIETLVVIDEFHVNGGYLTHSRQEFRDGGWAVAFHFNAPGAK